jgi:tRNA dimethylallyltransferase
MMERKGVEIHWLGQGSKASRIEEAISLVKEKLG